MSASDTTASATAMAVGRDAAVTVRMVMVFSGGVGGDDAAGASCRCGVFGGCGELGGAGERGAVFPDRDGDAVGVVGWVVYADTVLRVSDILRRLAYHVER